MTRFGITIGLVLAGCGSLGGEGGGGENLPNRGIIPYDLHDNRVVEADARDDPGVDSSGDVDPPELDPPTTGDAIVVANGDGYTVDSVGSLVQPDGAVLLVVEVTDLDGATRIDQTSSDDGLAFGALAALLDPSGVSPDAPQIGAPAPTPHENGMLVAFEVGGGATIGVAFVGTNGPEEVHAAVLEADADTLHEPSLVRVDDEWWLYYEARVETDDGPRPEIRLATSSDWRSFDAGTVVFSAGDECMDAFGEFEGCWDRRGVGSPEVRVARTALGRRIFRLWYAGGTEGGRSIGFASSFDGRDWARFPFNPIVAEEADEWSPTNVLLGGRYVLYGASDEGGVWAAMNDRPEPSERF